MELSQQWKNAPTPRSIGNSALGWTIYTRTYKQGTLMTQKWVQLEGITHIFSFYFCHLAVNRSSDHLYGTGRPKVNLQTNPFVTTVRRFGWNSHIQDHSGQIYRGNIILFDRLPKVIYLHYISSAEFDFFWHLFCLSKNAMLSVLSFRAHIEKAHWHNTWSTLQYLK